MNIQYSNKEKQIFESTLDLILAQGFHGTPVSQIAKKSNVAIGTIYHYFESKDKLIMQLYDYCKAEINQFIFDSEFNNASSTEGYKDKFFVVWKRFIEFYLANQTIFSFLEQFYSSPYHYQYQQTNSVDSYSESRLTKFLDEGVDLKMLKNIDPQIMYTICFGSVTLLIRSILYRNDVFTDEQVEQLIETIWNGITS